MLARSLCVLLPVVLALPLRVAGGNGQEEMSTGNTRLAADLVPQVVRPQLKAFFIQKEKQSRRFDELHQIGLPEDYWNYYRCLKNEDWTGATNVFYKSLLPLANYGRNDGKVPGLSWQTVVETVGIVELYLDGVGPHGLKFAERVIKSIPSGSVYIGGTDTGRFLITAFCSSHSEGRPFFTITQNAFADDSYLGYLREMYGRQLALPSTKEYGECFEEYVADAGKRLASHQLRPGEGVKLVDGKVEISGPVSVMAISALIAKRIFDRNPTRDFFVEESYALDWMYPYLSPHGFIFKLHRKPIATLSAEEVARDRSFWDQEVKDLIGSWLTQETTIPTLISFANRRFILRDLTGFKGERDYPASDCPPKMYSKLRVSLAGMFVWRAEQATSGDEKRRMQEHADYAFRQAFALCPYSLEAIIRYGNFLLQQKRATDARKLVLFARSLYPQDDNLRELERATKE